MALPIGDKWLILKKHFQNLNSPLVAQWLKNKDAGVMSRPIADGSSESSELRFAAPISNGNNGFWLVSPRGHYITVSEDLHRLDQRSVLNHLLDKSAKGAEWWVRSKPVFLLAWALAGLPLSLALGYILARIRNKDTHLFLCWGAAFYFLSGGLAMEKVLPMLR